jgi:hypothetical protein
VAQHEQLGILGQIRPGQHRQQAEQAPQQAVDERQQHLEMVPATLLIPQQKPSSQHETEFPSGTAFGYFDDAANRAVLDGIVRVLRPGGRLAMDLDNLTSFLASYCPSRVVAARENGDMLVDRYHLDALTGRFEAERTVIRSGQTRRVNFVKRLFGFPELRDWLLAAGFTAVTGYGEDSRPLTADHRRMVIVADLP